VVAIFDYGFEPDGTAFLVSEVISGGDLEAVLHRAKPIPIPRIQEWGSQIARALGAAHHLGVVHRDVKPANVMLRDGKIPVLCDFGIARAEQEQTQLTAEGLLLGSPAYMAPELWQGLPPSEASDQFAWAASLFELLYRQSVYPGRGPTEIVDAVRTRAPIRVPLEFRGQCPGLEACLMRALSFRAEQRYPDMNSFAVALEGSQGDGMETRELPLGGGPHFPEAPASKAEKTRALGIGPKGGPPPSLRGKVLRGLFLCLLVGLGLGFFSKVRQPAHKSSPPPVVTIPTQPEVPSPLVFTRTRHQALLEAERELRRAFGLPLEIQEMPPDRVVCTSFQFTELDSTLRSHSFRTKSLRHESLVAWKVFLEATLAWVEHLKTWEEDFQQEPGKALEDPEVQQLLDRLLFGLHLHLQEIYSVMVYFGEVQGLATFDTGALGRITAVRKTLVSLEDFHQSLAAVWDLESPGAPPASLQWIQRAGDFHAILIRDPPGQLLSVLERLHRRFLVAPPSRLTYLTGKAELYLLCFLVHRGGKLQPLSWPHRQKLLSQVEARLSSREWSQDAVGSWRRRLQARCLVEENRLIRLWKGKGRPPIDRARRVRLLRILEEAMFQPISKADVAQIEEAGRIGWRMLRWAPDPRYNQKNPRYARRWLEKCRHLDAKARKILRAKTASP
jgi:serine/threonine protein kinase